MADTSFLTIFKSVQNGNDVRGAAIATEKEAKTLTTALVQYIANGFSTFLAEKIGKEKADIRVGIGHDSRITADDFMKACSLGLADCHVYDCGLITTPAMFQSTILPASDFDGAIMLTASHLPFNRNGMKFFTKDGALSHADLDRILEIAAALADSWGSPSDEMRIAADRLPTGPNTSEAFDMVTVYCDHMQSVIKNAVKADDFDHPLAGLHIIVDSGNGASGFFATRILEPLGADIAGSQFLEPDGTFPNHVPNPENGEAMKSVQEATLASGADLGVIFDCDGDRGAVVFSNGTEVNRNTLIALLSVIVSESAPGSTVVTDSVTSDELAEFLGGIGIKHLRFKRGYKNVIDKGVELNSAGERCELAIETSGHGAFKENHFSDDGAYIAVKIICRMAQLLREGRKIESLIEDLKQPAESKEIRFSITADDFASYGKGVLADFRAYAEADPLFHIVEPNFEGIRIAFDDPEVKGWVLLRMSLHDPVMPMNLESAAPGGIAVIEERIAKFFGKYDKLAR